MYLKKILYQVLIIMCLGSSNMSWAGKDAELFEAIDKGNVKYVEKALEMGVNVNLKDKYGSTPLMHASAKCDLEITRILLNNGGKVNVIDNKGFTVYNYICVNPKTASPDVKQAIVKLLDKARLLETLPASFDPAKEPELIKAVYGRDINLIQSLISNGHNVNLQGSYGWTPLMHATAMCNYKIVKLLIDSGASVEIKDEAGRSVFEHVCLRAEVIEEKNREKIYHILNQSKIKGVKK